MRTTSKIAYEELVATGKATTQGTKILSMMELGVNYSLREIMKNIPSMEINAISGRVNDLKKSGKLKEAPKRKCSISSKLITPVYKAAPPIYNPVGDTFTCEVCQEEYVCTEANNAQWCSVSCATGG